MLYLCNYYNDILIYSYYFIFLSPSGWDNEKKISILDDNIQSFSVEDNYNDVIMPPHNINVSLIFVLLKFYSVK